MRKRLVLVLVGLFSLNCVLPSQAVSVPPSFIALAQSKILNKPGILIIDPATGATIFSSAPDALRAPASVLKLISTTTALKILGPDHTFTTTINRTASAHKFVLIGGNDPWITTSAHSAKKFHRVFSPWLINKAISGIPDSHSAKSIIIDYRNMYGADLLALQRFYKGKLKITFHQLPSDEAAKSEATEVVATQTSVPVKDIIDFTLLWSDNLLAQRLAMISAHQIGLPADAAGIQSTFTKVLSELKVSSEGLVVVDAAGLSHETRVSTRTITELLVEIKKSPDLAPIYRGLPTSGETGTLKTRFVKDAPNAVGLIHAKTGWINTTVSLAGFVTVGESQYAFAVIADRLPDRESVRSAARVTIDKMLATIAKPAPTASPTLP